MSNKKVNRQDGDNEPVLVVLNKSRRLVHAGQPDTFSKKQLADYAKQGNQIKTITIKKFRETNYKWHWE